MSNAFSWKYRLLSGRGPGIRTQGMTGTQTGDEENARDDLTRKRMAGITTDSIQCGNDSHEVRWVQWRSTIQSINQPSALATRMNPAVPKRQRATKPPISGARKPVKR